MSPAVRAQVVDVIERQRYAIEAALERNDLGYAVAVTRRMATLEAALGAEEPHELAD